jgi:hypothetical protein
MLNIIFGAEAAGARASSRYGSGSHKMMRLHSAPALYKCLFILNQLQITSSCGHYSYFSKKRFLKVLKLYFRLLSVTTVLTVVTPIGSLFGV